MADAPFRGRGTSDCFYQIQEPLGSGLRFSTKQALDAHAPSLIVKKNYFLWPVSGRCISPYVEQSHILIIEVLHQRTSCFFSGFHHSSLSCRLCLLSIHFRCYDYSVDNHPYFFSPKKKLKSKAAEPAPAAPIHIDNLEAQGEALKVYSLQNLLRNKRSSKLITPMNLCDVAKKLYEKEVAKPSKSLDGVVDLWLQHVPKELQEGTRLIGLARGTLNVSVNSSALRAELEGLLRSGLLRTLQTASNGTIFRIKTSVQSPIQNIS